MDLIASDAGKITRTLARVYRDGERGRERERVGKRGKESEQKDNHGSIEMIHNGSMQGRPKLTGLKYILHNFVKISTKVKQSFSSAQTFLNRWTI